MCSIFCSFDKKRILELYQLNSSRGECSFSITNFDLAEDGSIQKISIHRSREFFDPDLISDQGYHICHIQAPTGERTNDLKNIHPAEWNGHLLWHNGIVKDKDIKRLQQKQNISDGWDTALLLNELEEEEKLENISQIDGSFACIYLFENKIFLFRNDLAPLYYSRNKMDISSVPWINDDVYCECKYLTSNIYFQLIFTSNSSGVLKPAGEFTTFDNPYFFGEWNGK